ncbi:uncharacterized protein [Anabrus simplex]|uniref:uncharacterized protein n=1 Tax=Anabrus simplex TaxID=316456 RepID=UPI0035A37F8B
MLPDRWCILGVLSLITGVILLPVGTRGFTFDLFQRKNNSHINATTASNIGSTTNRLSGVQVSTNVPRTTGRMPAVSSASPSPTTEVPQTVPSPSNTPEASSDPPVSQQEESSKIQMKSTIIRQVPFQTLKDGYITQIDVESEPQQVFQSDAYTGGSNMGLVPSTFLGTSQNTLIYPENSWNNYALYSYQPTPWDIRSLYEYPTYPVQPVPWVNPRVYDLTPAHPWRYGQLYNAYNSRYSPPVTNTINSVAWNRYRRQVFPMYNGRFAPFSSYPYYAQSYPSQYTYPFTNPAFKTYKKEFVDFEYIPYAKVESMRTPDMKSAGKSVQFSKPHKEHPHIEVKSGKEKENENVKPKNKIHFLVPQIPPESDIKKDTSEEGKGAENSMTRYQSQYPFSFNNHHGHPIRHGHHNPFYNHQYWFTY